MTPDEITLHSLLWGPCAETVHVVEHGHVDPDLFTDPSHRKVAEIVVEIVTDTGMAPTVMMVYGKLIDVGMDDLTARGAVVLEGAFAAAGCRTDGLVHHLHRLREQRDREILENRLVTLADRLKVPGGPARVAAELGVTADA